MNGVSNTESGERRNGGGASMAANVAALGVSLVMLALALGLGPFAASRMASGTRTVAASREASVPAASLAETDPRRLPFPEDDFDVQRQEKSLVIGVSFTGRDTMQVDSSEVVYGQTRGQEGDPPLLELVLRDRANRVLGLNNEWHPLWAHVWDAPPSGSEFVPWKEHRIVRQAAQGRFIIPFDPRVRWIDVLDVANNRAPVGQVDVGRTIRRFCNDHPNDPDCLDIPAAILYVNPVENTVAGGDVITVELRVRNVEDLYGGQIAMSFDPAVAQIVDTDPGRPGAQIEPGEFLLPDVIFRNVADNATGRLEYFFSLQGEKPGATGGGVLARIGLRGVGEGTSLLGLGNVVLSHSDSLEIRTQTYNGQLTVETRTVALTGRVILERRDSNAGARVCVGQRCAETDEQGAYRLAGVPPGGVVNVTHPSYLRAERTLDPQLSGEVVLPNVTLLAGDLDKDDTVDVPDAVMIGQRWDLRYNAAAPDPLWLEGPDITDDDVVNITDMVGVQYNLRQVAPGPWPVGLAQDDVFALALDDWRAPAPPAVALQMRPSAVDAAAQAPTLRLLPRAARASGLGLVVPLDIRVENVQRLYGFRVRLRFDPAVLRVADASTGVSSPGVQVRVGEFLDPFYSFVLLNDADNATGTIDLAMTQTRPADGRTGSGVLGTILFTGVAKGQSPVGFAEVVLSDDTLPVPRRLAAGTDGATITIGSDSHLIYGPWLEKP